MELSDVGRCLINIGRGELLVLTLWGVTWKCIAEMAVVKLERSGGAGRVTHPFVPLEW